MAVVTGSKRRRVLERVGLYAGLGAFGAIMLFPFLVVAFGSLKESSDIFRFPPRLLPYSQDTVEIDGEDQGLYVVEGVERVLLETITVGLYAPPDALEDTVVVPTADTERRGGFLDAETVEIDGEEVPLYDVEVDGEVVAMVERSTTTQGRFAAVDDPGDVVGANVRLAEQVDSVDPQPQNFRRVTELQNLDRSLTNTLLVTLLVVGGTVLTSILGGYAFARIEFPGRDAMFLVY
ncbi:MAG: hypothetical protein EA340_03685, partial [Nitriliruptor sp.]